MIGLPHGTGSCPAGTRARIHPLSSSTGIIPRRLLVVDDDPDFAESLAGVLEIAGHRVEVALSGDAAVTRCRAETFDMALLDVAMPGMNGVESLRAMRAIQPSLRAVMMTGYAVQELLDDALRVGAWRVLSKPLDPEHLLALIERGCGGLLLVVADDDPDFAHSLAQTLEHSGHRAVLAHDGEQALQRVREQSPDVLVLDLRMPARSGIEVVRALADRGRVPAVVVVTAYADEEASALAELTAHPLLGVLEKPVHPDRLLDILSRVTRA